jgi:hypothetical protein
MAPHRWLIITLAVDILLALPAAEAQQQGNIPLVGVLEPNPAITGCFAALGGWLRIDAAKPRAAARLSGKCVIKSHDESLTPTDLALGYTQL